MEKETIALLYSAATAVSTGGISPIRCDWRLSSFIQKYEHVRNIIGFQDEHLWRTHAILRMAKRYIKLYGSERFVVETFLEELVIGGYIPEDALTGESVRRVEEVLQKYLAAYNSVISSHAIARRQAYYWFLGLLAIEIEDILGLLDREKAALQASIRMLKDRLQFPPFYFTEEEKDIFLLLAATRTFLKREIPFAAYTLIEKQLPAWFKGSDDRERLASYAWTMREKFRFYERHPLHKEVIRITRPHGTVMIVLARLVNTYHMHMEAVGAKAERVLDSLYKELKEKMRRRIANNLIFLIITKAVLVVAIEVSYDIWRQGEVQWAQLALNMSVPLLFFLLFPLSARVTNQKNTEETIREVERLLKGEQTRLETRVMLPKEQTIGASILYRALLGSAYSIVYGGLVYGLYRLHFNLVGIFFFVLLITMATLLGVRLRYHMEELRIVPATYRISVELVYFLGTPMLVVGQWIVNTFAGQNSLLLIMIDRLIEPPFKRILFFIRNFSDFMREKRELIA